MNETFYLEDKTELNKISQIHSDEQAKGKKGSIYIILYLSNKKNTSFIWISRNMSYICRQMSNTMYKEPKNKTIEVNEAISTYVRTISPVNMFAPSNKNLTYSDFLSNRMLIIQSIQNGIPYSLFKHIKANTPFTETDWAGFLNISTKSLQRYKIEEDHIFKSIHSEKIIELAEVTNLGKEVFDTSEQFYIWLNSTSFALGNMKPVELLRNSYGKEMVINELNRIDQGIFV